MGRTIAHQLANSDELILRLICFSKYTLTISGIRARQGLFGGSGTLIGSPGSGCQKCWGYSVSREPQGAGFGSDTCRDIMRRALSLLSLG